MDAMSPFPPILLLTCKARERMAASCVDLLDKFWPDHGEIVPVEGTKSTARWTEEVLEIVATLTSPLVMIWLDDYMMLEPPDLDLLRATANILESDPDVGRIDVWQPLPPAIAYERDPRFLYHPVWPYPVILQAGIWKTASLVRVFKLLPGVDPWNFELRAGKLQNEGKLDLYQLATATKAVNYANLLSLGKLRHPWILQALRDRGVALKEEDLPTEG